MRRKNPLIMIVDDEDAIRRSVAKILEYEGFKVVQAENGEQGCNLALQEEPDLILLDIKMPRMDGMEALQVMVKQGTTAPIVMISGHGTIQTALDATRIGAFDFLEKPLDRERLLLSVRNALSKRDLESEKKALQEENQELKRQVSASFPIIGEHPGLKSLLERVDRVAPTKASVLITGESGTGKELIARRIHEMSGRSGRMVQVNCAAIPNDLIESELFGHVKGAFTGAVENQPGKFQLAHQGTIFLDEVADMSLNTQAKVLRVLQEGEVEAVGSGKTIRVDVRVVAATNKDLVAMIEKGEFREDLYYRLNVVPLASIPLQARRSDIPLLVAFFSEKFCAENGLGPKTWSAETLTALRNRTYRGNIRELKNLVERILILGEEEVLGADGPAVSNDPFDFSQFQTLRAFKEETERQFLIAKLRDNSGNISRTAEAIDTPRSNLYKKLEQYQIQVDQIEID
ncbi:MAG: sigma-54-dependent Fis family transcriptional regulator [Acidobacteria bacterium]|nr:sigma-54-dependent Fis family transcriptional regulator [Acidobacteriota bacterium]MCB9397511.1 sigma-54-dependent Fis family transcriptional regulator [Acidobacteriota bacterium]